MSKYVPWVGYALLCVVLIVGFVRCNWLRAIGGNAISDCGPELISDVAGILIKDGWQNDLNAKAAEVGLAAVNCAVRSVLKSLEGAAMPGGIPPAPAASLVRLPASFERRTVLRKRGEQWLTQHK